MRFAALSERTPAGWRAWIPALPDVHVEAPTSAAAEEDLARALESYLREQRTSGAMDRRTEVRCFYVEVKTRADLRRPPEQTDADRRRVLERLDAVLAEDRKMPSWVVDAVFRYRREVADGLPDDSPAEPDEILPGNVVVFVPRGDR